MNRVPSPYSNTARRLHWLIVALVVIQFITALTMPDIGPNVVPGTLINLHLSFGLLILIVMAIRFVHRLSHPVPLEAAGTPPWENTLAHLTHRLFYFILLVGPFLGWASASAHRLPVSLFGIIPLPALAAPRARWALQAGDVHAWMMWALLVMIGLHVAAALYHHFIRHDTILRRMLPGR
ncbi:cytochrome b [Noviherbaspirillum pedocola]|uniref:Cytochrome b n=1 Tax=Noviherbaspirillum pedocola TaxID=2801341 RepID=A0A934SUL3_9BURK|nr:cytochrome b [Noviherbaspirillum pedocola]MBK4735859.1 cytochrome b [Noviherbaspirillum pedocola]